MYGIWIICGLLLIGVAAHDLFHTLFHPAQSGALSDWTGRVVWSIFRTTRNPRMLTLAGPFAMLTIVILWATLIIVGAALMYWPNLAKDIVVAPGLNQSEHLRFSDAINLSLGSVITFGGDMNSRSQMLRFVMGLESVLGFGVLTGSISWLLSVYPVLERRSSLAHESTLLHQAEKQTGIDLFELPEESLHSILLGLASAVTTLRNDMVQFPVTYYFHKGTHKAQLPSVLPFLWQLAIKASRPHMSPAVRIAGSMLHDAIQDLLAYIGKMYLNREGQDAPTILDAYLKDHLNQPLVALPARRPPIAA